MPDDLLPTPGEPQLVQDDMLGQLLIVAAREAAKKEAQDALTKGFVTRGDINAALGALSEGLESKIVGKIEELLMPKVVDTVKQAVEATPALRKSTIQTPEDELEDDPVKYILKKAREQGPEAYNQTEKDLVWAITKKALEEGMAYDNREEE